MGADVLWVLANRPKIVTMPAKQVQRKPRQEAKAEITALLEKVIPDFSSCLL
jgi:hypothetical protein